ncbi:prepilin-type N-terminal cleavage/methylation domain-containing protein [Aeoliella sp. SH292]|uniref:prepilin-type N-terminal cleavage/methylation domain-containing protein n=1 Tax=Aeoliella sp. SH292 TaxID=3454464 RepID=UPI003F9A3BB6
MHVPRYQRWRGFTLLELLVVLALLALIAAMAVSRTGGSYQRAQFKTALKSFASYDDQSRHLAARKHTPLELRIDLRKSTIECRDDREMMGQPCVLPKSVRIERFLSLRERKSSGLATVRLGPGGESESYAVQLSTAATPAEWLLFAGGSGQAVSLQDTREVEEVFRVLKSNSPHSP